MKVFDKITRVIATPLPWWRTLAGIFALLIGAVFTHAEQNPDPRGNRDAERPREAESDTVVRVARARDTYDALLSHERRAAALTLNLDAQLDRLDSEEDPLGQRLELLKGERELFLAELPINELLPTVYATLLEDQETETDQLVVRAALLHWTVLLRRRSMQEFHTVVPGLENDPDCKGDIIGNQLLWAYFDGLFEEPHGTTREARVVRALTDLARQSACLGAQQSAQLASDLYWSFVELRGFLRLNGIERIVPYVAQAAAAPMLLFYDVEKYRGPQSPLARWFEENYEWLVQGVTSKRLPMSWHGLWLYDWRTGHLMGYRHTPSPVDENDVHLAAFFASIVSRENLGRYDCTFAEMVERGLGPHGYMCTGSICAQAKQSSQSPIHSHGPGVMIGSTPSLSPLATFGFSADVLQETLCKQSTTGGHGGGGGGGRLCGDTGIKGIGRNWESDYVRCVAQQAVQPGMKVVRCMAEAMGLCSHPLDKFAKEMQEVQFHGVKMGSGCQVGKGMGDVKKTEYVKQKEQDAADARVAAQKAEAAATAAEAASIKAQADDLEVRGQLDKFADTGDPTTTGEVKVIVAGIAVLAADARAAKAAEEARAAKAEAEKAEAEAEKAEAEAKKAKEEQESKPKDQKKDTKGDPCPPDTPDCGGNECTGMSQTLLQVLACVEAEAKQEELDKLHRQPGWVDPSPEGFGGKLWDRCFGAFEDVHPVNKDCWWKDCGPQNVTSKITAGTCGCGPSISAGAGTHLTSMCGDVDCPDGVPSVQNNRCTCGTGGAFGGGVGGPIPKGMFTLSSPRLFSEVRVRDVYTNVERDTTFGGSPLGGGPQP
jgi:hypothetical protein